MLLESLRVGSRRRCWSGLLRPMILVHQGSRNGCNHLHQQRSFAGYPHQGRGTQSFHHGTSHHSRVFSVDIWSGHHPTPELCLILFLIRPTPTTTQTSVSLATQFFCESTSNANLVFANGKAQLDFHWEQEETCHPQTNLGRCLSSRESIVPCYSSIQSTLQCHWWVLSQILQLPPGENNSRQREEKGILKMNARISKACCRDVLAWKFIHVMQIWDQLNSANNHPWSGAGSIISISYNSCKKLCQAWFTSSFKPVNVDAIFQNRRWPTPDVSSWPLKYREKSTCIMRNHNPLIPCWRIMPVNVLKNQVNKKHKEEERKHSWVAAWWWASFSWWWLYDPLWGYDGKVLFAMDRQNSYFENLLWKGLATQNHGRILPVPYCKQIIRVTTHLHNLILLQFFLIPFKWWMNWHNDHEIQQKKKPNDGYNRKNTPLVWWRLLSGLIACLLGSLIFSWRNYSKPAWILTVASCEPSRL